MKSNLTGQRQGLVCLRLFVVNILKCLLNDSPLPSDKATAKMWRQYWGRAAYSDRYCQHVLDLQTRRRKAFLLLVYRIACKTVDIEEIRPGTEAELRSRLAMQRSRMRPYVACVAMAFDAALARLWLKNNPRKKKLAICYSAFGNIRQISRTYARELRHIFHSVFDELLIFGCAGLEVPLQNIPEVSSVKINFRNVTLNELVLFSGIKAPGLIGACADAVREGADIIITVDGDGRLPLFETVGAVATMLQSNDVSSVLGSRRIAGAVVIKPGFRHLISLLNALYTDFVMRPVLGHISDPQAIFKVFRAQQLNCALEKIGYRQNGIMLSDLQDGSLACELLLLGSLGDQPQLVEVPVIETMTYPANPKRMPIITAENVRGMIAAANRPRMSVRERALIGEGTEFLVVNQAEDEVLKFPRCPERLGEQRGLPSSRITDNRLVAFTMSLPCVFRTLFCGFAGRFHPERGFGINRASIDLISDKRDKVKAFVPTNMRWEWRDHAIRLPLFTAILVKLFWGFDRFLLDSGIILQKIGMLPMIVIRFIGCFFRFLSLMAQWFHIGLRPLMRFLKKFLSRLLLIWDRLYFLMRAGLRRMVTVLELCHFLDLFTLADKLDQRWRFFHRCLSGFLRVLVEIRWLLEGNVTIHFGRPVACIVQPQKIRPFWQVLAQIPNSMPNEAEKLFNTAFELYAGLGENGYFDGELSLDNIGFEFEMSKAHLMLIDYGSLVNCKRSPPWILGPWLREVRKHYEQSYQVYKLRAYAEGSPSMKQVIERYIQNMLELIDEWIHCKETEIQVLTTKCY